jgi:hypothetical protein
LEKVSNSNGCWKAASDIASFRNNYHDHKPHSGLLGSQTGDSYLKSRKKLPEDGYGRDFQNKDLIEASLNYISNFLYKKDAESCETINAHSKSTDLI